MSGWVCTLLVRQYGGFGPANNVLIVRYVCDIKKFDSFCLIKIDNINTLI